MFTAVRIHHRQCRNLHINIITQRTNPMMNVFIWSKILANYRFAETARLLMLNLWCITYIHNKGWSFCISKAVRTFVRILAHQPVFSVCNERPTLSPFRKIPPEGQPEIAEPDIDGLATYGMESCRLSAICFYEWCTQSTVWRAAIQWLFRYSFTRTSNDLSAIF